MNQSSSSHSREIDGLRALAVLSVMAYHLRETYLPGGFTGVDIFFVISGFVVSKSLTERVYHGAGNYILEFYLRRIIRILPALLVMLVVVSLLTIMFIPASWLSKYISVTGLSAFFGVSNITLARFDEAYFSPLTDFNPFVHTWSLGVEEQFYVVFPLLFLSWSLWRNEPGIKRSIVWLILPVFGLASFFSAYALGAGKPDWAFYLLPSRFWELAAGAFLYQCHTVGRLLPASERNASLLLLLGLALCLAGLVWSDREHFPYPWALLPVVGTLFIIASVRCHQVCHSLGHRILRHSITVYLGKISYSLYLWHWPVYTLLRWTTGLENYWYQLLAVGLTMLLSMASFHFVERGIQKAARAAPARSITKVIVGLACVLVLFFSTQSLFEHRSQLSLSQTRDTYNWYPHYHPVTDLDGAEKPFVGRQIFVVGNSHSSAYATMLNEAAVRLGVTPHIRDYGGCAMVQIIQPIGNLPACDWTMDSLMTLLEQQARPGDIVFFASLRTFRLSDQWFLYDSRKMLAHSKKERIRRRLGEARDEASELIGILGDMDLQVVIDMPKPVFEIPVFRCSDWFNSGNPVCRRGFEVEKKLLTEMSEPVVSALLELKGRHTNLILWDPFPTLCPGEFCVAFDEQGLPLFFDGDHLSGHGNRVLYPEFANLLKRIWQ